MLAQNTLIDCIREQTPTDGNADAVRRGGSGSGSGRESGGGSGSSGPSAPNQTTNIMKPAPSGNAKIDKFVDSTFDLNDKIIALKNKLKEVSEDVAESNKIL